MNGAAIPLVMVAVAMLFGGKKKTTKSKSKDEKDDYEENDRTKRPPNRKKKPPGTDLDDDLDDDDYDPEFSDEECGPGWVLLDDGQCHWLSDYEAPNVPPDGLWIAPDCRVVVVGKDWWEDVALPLIQEYVDDGEGYSHRHPGTLAQNDPDGTGTELEYYYDWWSTAQGLAYQILLPYDMGPVNDTTGMRDTDEVCLDVFPFVTYDFPWYTPYPEPKDFGVKSADTEEPEWLAYYQAREAWEQDYLAYLEAVDEKMPGLHYLYRMVVATIEAYYLDVYGDNG